MTQYITFSNFSQARRAEHNEVSFNLVALVPELDEKGEPIPIPVEPIKLTGIEKLRFIQPYATVRFMDQAKAVIPLALYLILFKLLILDQIFQDGWLISGGLFAVIVGLMFFMEGLTLGLMPFGEVIGSGLPRHSPLPLVLFITLLLGIGVTFAEPAIGALQIAGQNVDVERAPYLFALLNNYSQVLVLVVGASVGLAAVIGTLRFLYGWTLKPLIYFSLVPVLLLSLYAGSDPDLIVVLGMAWDAGAVTTGPVTVPLVLALGIGIAAAAGKSESGLSGFGIVTLASLFPIIGVLLLTLYIATAITPAEIIEAAGQAAQAAQGLPLGWYARSPGVEIVLGVRAILPLVIFLFIVLKLVLKEKLHSSGQILYGIGLTLIGMCIFNVGLTYGLSKLGGITGAFVPGAFMSVETVPDSPLYVYKVGLIIALAFAWVLGFGATIAEPALNTLGITAEELTNGVFKKKALINAVSIGVAFGIALGLARLIFNLPLLWLIVPGYLVAIVLTFLSNETFVNVAWDSAGVTTGPITVPLVLALGLGFGNATNAVEGFGILCMASIGPIIAVMTTGLWTRFQANRQLKAARQETEISPGEEAPAIL
ncbi:MAG: DUF1538 family protein [Desulfobacterales bacterium]|nr:DUF1538 family protein [Desulfobacterales bacterium]